MVERPTLKSQRPQFLIHIILVLAVICNLILPGEVFYQSKYILILTFLLASYLTVLESLIIRNNRQFVRPMVWAAGFILILSLSVFHSINRYRTEDVIWLFVAYACLFLCLRLLPFGSMELLAVFLLLTLTTFGISLFSLYQYFFGLGELKQRILQSTNLEESFKAGLLTRIGTRRVFANFALPNTLAGLLVIVLPLQLLLVQLRGRAAVLLQATNRRLAHLLESRGAHIFFIVQLLAGVAVLGLTQSFGGWISLTVVCGVLIWSEIRIREISAKDLSALAIGFLLAMSAWVVLITKHRGFALWNLQAADNPVSLRWINYRTAWKVFEDFPWTGVGLGNYGSINPFYQADTAHVTQYTHNTVLQLLSECGMLWVVLLAISIVWLLHRRLFEKTSKVTYDSSMKQVRACLTASLLAWTIHNCLDINLYFPSLGSLGVLLLAIWTDWGKSPTGSEAWEDYQRSRIIGVLGGDQLGSSEQTGFIEAPQEPFELSTVGENTGGPSSTRSDLSSSFRGPHGVRASKSRIFRRADTDRVSRFWQSRWVVILLTLVFAGAAFRIAGNYLGETYYHIAIEQAELRNYEKALSLLRQSMHVRPSNPDAIVLEGKIAFLTSKGKAETPLPALHHLREALECASRIDPWNANYSFELSRVLLALGRIEEAKTAASRAKYLFPSEIRFQTNLDSLGNQK